MVGVFVLGPVPGNESKTWWVGVGEGGWQNHLFPGFEPDVNRTRNLLIWSQTRYHCATDP